MGNEIIKFANEEFGEIRTVLINDEPWFVGKDIVDRLGYQNGSRDINRHVDEDDRTKIMVFDGNQNKETIIINESGLYSLILSSKLPSATRFKRWVTSEVLPTIRKTGGYVSDSELMVNTYFGNLPFEQQAIVKGLLDNVTAQQKIINSQRNEIDSLTATNEVLTTDVLSWADRNLVNALVRKYATNACCGDFAFAWTEFKKELLYKHGININSRITAYLNKVGKRTKPKTLEMISDDEVLLALKTIASMCDAKKVDISELLTKHKAELVG